ncbi:hypothetical protein M7I_8294 [Glarea lozoyensis 74030]|uniref:DUF7607 domain-containing protein n=1 Tax=Glarea lozoyensis (strain ATCC 74030 / MF5533) TaxID=1104152 RepID=H0EZL8_GLAL7|nr:hypothetical protein M7I_8294 [Glarea lozoyensis 74030]
MQTTPITILFSSRTAVAKWILNQPDLNAEITTFLKQQTTVDMDIDDPWDWAIDRLVQELCTENRTWQSSVNNASRPDPEALETKLRDNAVVGTTILLDVGDSEMKDDLGITKLGHRSWMRDAIRALQLRSPKYHSYRHTHTIGSDLFHTTSHRGVQPGGSHESVSVADLVVPTTNRGNADPPFPILSSITPDDSEGQPGTDGEHPTGSPNRKKPKLDNATAVIDNDLLGAAMTGDSPIEEPHGAQGALDAMADVPVSGCLSFVDVNGKKRKRLAPTLVTTVIDPTRNRDILTYAEEAIRFKLHNEPISLDPAVDFENPDLDADNVVDFDSRSGTSSFQPVAESTEPRLDAGQNSEFIAQRLSMTPPPFVEPGKPYIDLNGRKRMLPIVQSNVDILEPREQGNTVLEESPDVQGPVSSDATIGDGNIKFVVAEARNTASKIPPPSYLDRKRFLVDDVFYENTAIGADASLPEAELEFVVAPTKLPPGRRLYVHSVMKRFFRSEPIAFTRGGKEMFAVVPYSPELRPKFSTTSFTLYRPVEGHIDITRENIASWPEVGSKDDTHLVSDIEGRTVTFNPAGPDMLESMMNKNNEWNYEALEKYMGVEGGDEILPAYGESDSDNDYDEATLREIEADKGIKLDRKVGKSRKPPLSAQEVEFIIDEAVASHATRWRENKLPKIQHKAYKIWCKSRKQKSLKLDIKAIKNELESLETRLQKLRDAISKQPWTSRIQVLKQSTILEGTVFDREAAKWTMGVLGSKERPEKPAKQTPKVKLPKVAVEEEGESLEDEPESSSSGESLDDFIASEDSGCEENCELNLADAEISDNAMTMSDASLSESPVTPDKKIKIIYQGSSFRHPSEVFSKPASPNTGSDSALLSPKIEDSTPGKLSMPKTHNSGDIIELSSDDNQVIYDLVTPEKRRPKIILRHTPPKFAGSGAITITDDETASPSPPRVRDLKNDPVAISKLSFKDWEARKDRRGLLIAVFQKMTAELRRRTFNLLSRLNAAHLWVHMNNVMSACAMQDFHVPGMGVSLYDLVIVVVALYEIYVDCKYRRYTIPPNPLKIQALRGAQMHEHYGPFHQLCLEIVNVFKGRTSKPSTAPSSIIFKKSKIGKISDQERALEEDAGFQSSGKSQTPATEPSEDEEDGEPVSAIRNRRPQLAPS